MLVLWSIGSTQNPTKAPYGATITLVPSLGHEPATVPSIPTSYTFNQAQAALQAVGLTATQNNESSATVPSGQVISTSPASGAAGALRLGGDGQRLDRAADDARSPTSSGTRCRRPPPRCRAPGLSVSGVSGSPSNMVSGTQPSVGSTVPTGSSVQIFTH